MGRLTTHVLDTAHGRPAAGLSLTLYRLEGGRREIATVTTNADGRCDLPLLEGPALTAGVYEIVFEAGAYFDALELDLPQPKFLDAVAVRFGVADPGGHYHVPLLLSPFGYSTYRGELMEGSRDTIRFLLGDEPRALRDVPPTLTVLEYLRRRERLTGTKEGCAEGDCGACTVVFAEPDGEGGLRRWSVNSCIQFVPGLDGRQLLTVEHLKGRDGRLHPVQQALVDHHGSQCGFCTPGFVMSLYAAWCDGGVADRQDLKDWLSGNLCRCTGYGPILDAGMAALKERPDRDDGAARTAAALQALDDGRPLSCEHSGQRWFAPRTADGLADLYLAHPDAILVAGATDVGLWVTKQHRRLATLIDVTRISELKRLEETADALVIGAGVSHRTATPALARLHPSLSEVMRRFASIPIRNSGTVGGNIANGSPIGDLAPVFIALGATLHLRKGDGRRALALEDFFLAYGRQDRAPGEFVEAVTVPRPPAGARFFCHKLSKRFDQDISAVMGAFRLDLDGGAVRDARLAFGGMAATPKRAPHAEAALRGRPFARDAVEAVAKALEQDFTPITDMRASARYRMLAAQNLLRRFHLEQSGDAPTRMLEPAHG